VAAVVFAAGGDAMMTVQQAVALALQHHQAGRVAEAEAIYRQVLTVEPNHADAWQFLGLLARQAGRYEQAVELIGRAVAIQPNNPGAHSNLGSAYRAMGKLGEAIACYRRALQLQPDLAAVHHNLGNALREQGRLHEASEAYRCAIDLQPETPETQNNLGQSLIDQGKLDEAIAALRCAIDLNPDYAEAHNYLGIALLRHNRLDGALTAFRRAIECQYGYAEAYNNLGNVYMERGQLGEAGAAYREALSHKPDLLETHRNLGRVLRAQGDLDGAISAYHRALEIVPTHADVHHHLGIALADQGGSDDAIAAFRQALEFKPDYAPALCSLGNVLMEQGHVEQAIAACRRAIELQPELPEAHNNLGNALAAAEQLDDAIEAFRMALRYHPRFWQAHSNLGNAFKDQGKMDEAIAEYREALSIKQESAAVWSNLRYALLFLPWNDEAAMREESRRWHEQFGHVTARASDVYSNTRDPDRRLRIGYVSPDLRDHVVGRNVRPLFAHHDHENFEIVCYSGVTQGDSLTEELRQHAGLWRNTAGVSDEELARLIQRDEVDILVDLSQYLAGNRLPVFAGQPAPVQVSFAGYPETTGLEAIPYRISDRFLESRQERESDPKELLFLIDSFWCYDPCGMEMEINARPARTNGSVTFGSLNNFCKVNEAVLELWAQVMEKVKDSRLILLTGFGSHRQRVQEILQGRGVEAERVEFVKPCPRREYLQLFHRLDIALDPFPYNGHTTSLDALWMGVPVVSLAGERAVSRAGLSQLTNLGLPELVAFSEEDYVKIAVQLANDLPRLAEWRRTLRPRMEASVLMDAPRFARQIENAYRTMWRQWCAKESGK
jgi:predicted O-linked N-acetylglucosamine transferase (SPINDLY family)